VAARLENPVAKGELREYFYIYWAMLSDIVLEKDMQPYL